MRSLQSLIFGITLLATVTASAQSSQRRADRPPQLRGAQCLDPDFARAWIAEDDRHLLIDAGRYKYRVEVTAACSALSYSNVIGFRGDPVIGRVCGGLGDAILTRDYPCRIESMQLLSKEQYKRAVDDRNAYRKLRKSVRRVDGG